AMARFSRCSRGLRLRASRVIGKMLIMPYFIAGLIEGIGTPAQDAIVDGTHATERPGKQFCLFWSRVEAVLVGAFRHASQNNQINVKIATT
ncbi:hypothetical protein, partial [Azotobacter salinestris]